MLFKVEKIVLINSMAQALPSYTISVFLLHVSLYDELQKMMNNYLWDSDQRNGHGIIWQRYDKLCKKKEYGGLGFRNLHCF